jgi:lipopolysaccharide biosynthesis glycosyltransferase
MDKKLKVSYISSEAYSVHAGISILSLLENNKMFDDIDIFFVYDDLRTPTKDKLIKTVSDYGRKIEFIHYKKLCPEIKVKGLAYYSQITFTKLFLHRLEQLDKILFLDSDSIINGSLYDVWNLDMGSNYVAGVKIPTPKSETFNECFGAQKFPIYINSGFELLNTALIRIDKIDERILDFLVTNKDKVFIEENIMNYVYINKIIAIHPKYNITGGIIKYNYKQLCVLHKENYFYNSDELLEAKRKPIFIHYLNEIYNRPWEKFCTHPYAYLYRHYKVLSLWKDIPRTYEKRWYINLLKRYIRNLIPFCMHKMILKIMKKY